MPLTRLAALGQRTVSGDEPTTEELIAGIREGLDRAMERMSERPIPPVVEGLRKAAKEPIEPGGRISGLSAEQEAVLDRDSDRSREDDRSREAGGFPVRIESPRDAKPTAAQEAACRFLMGCEDEICRAIMETLFASYRQYYQHEQGQFAIERLRALYGLPEIATPDGLTAISHLLYLWLPRITIEGVSPLVFAVDCDWEAEHGMFVVYHPTLGVEWTCFDGLHDYELLDDGRE